MALLNEMILNLPRGLQPAFDTWLFNRSGECQELIMYRKLLKKPEISRAELMSLFYKKNNRNAFDAIRKRLIDKLKIFIVEYMSDPKLSPLGSILSEMMVTEFYRQFNAFEPVVHFLDSAKNTAEKNNHFDILDSLYSYEVRHGGFLNTSIEEVAKKRKLNAAKFEIKRKLELADTDIQIALAKAKASGETLDPEYIINDVIGKFKLKKEEMNIPEFQFKIMSMFRNAMVSTKEYYRLEPIIIRAYNDLKLSKAFHQGTVAIELGFLYMISHVFMRNRNFKSAFVHINQMDELFGQGDFQSSLYKLKFYSVKACLLSYTGKNKSGITLLTQGLKLAAKTKFKVEQLNMELNQVVFEFQAKNYVRSKKLLFEMDKKYTGLEKIMGPEWCFKRELIRLIVMHELGDSDGARQQLARMRKNYRAFLKRPMYANAKMFLKYIGKVVRNPKCTNEKSFRRGVREALETWELHSYDLQSVTFFCWLKCKIQQRDYYEVLLEELNSMEEKGKP